MFCPSCGTQNGQGVAFCGNCGVSLAQPQPVSTAMPAPVKPNFFKSRNGIIAIVAVGVLLIGSLAAVVVNFPKTVNVKLAVNAVNGGVFTSDCTVQPDAASLVPKSLKVTNSGGSTVGSVNLKFFTAPEGGCVGQGQVSLNPNGTYSVVADSKPVGTIAASEFSAGVANVGYTVALTRTIHVAFTLYDKADYCSGTTDNWRCSWNDDYVFGLHLNSSDSTCEGQNGYSDIYDGTTVTMVGRSNHQTFTGKLVNDRYDLVSIASKQIACKFNTTFTDVPNDDLGYSVQVSHRGYVDYDLSSIRDNDWTAEVALNQ